MSAMLKFKKGLQSALPTQINEGTVYITTDEKAMYVDVDSETRIRIGQIITLTSEEWETLPTPFSPDVFYYITNLNALIRWKEEESKWIQINSTKELSDRVGALETIVGKTENEGIRATIATHGLSIQSIKTTIGDDTKGLIATVNSIDSRLNGLEASGGQPNIIEGIRVNGTVVNPDENKIVSLGKLAGIGAKVAKEDLTDSLQSIIDSHGIQLGNKLNTSDFNSYKEEVANNFDTANQSIRQINSILGNGFSSAQGETVTDVINAMIDAEAAQNEVVTGHTNAIESLRAKNNTQDLAIEEIRGALDTKVSVETYNARVGADGTLTALAQKGVDDAKAAQNTADANTILIRGNADAISANTVLIRANTDAISSLRTLVDNTTNIMNFLGAVLSTDAIGDPQPGDVVVVISTGKEYVYDKENGWVELGDASGNANAIKDLSEDLSGVKDRVTTLEGKMGEAETTLQAQGIKIQTNINDIALLKEHMTWSSFTE